MKEPRFKNFKTVSQAFGKSSLCLKASSGGYDLEFSQHFYGGRYLHLSAEEVDWLRANLPEPPSTTHSPEECETDSREIGDGVLPNIVSAASQIPLTPADPSWWELLRANSFMRPTQPSAPAAAKDFVEASPNGVTAGVALRNTRHPEDYRSIDPDHLRGGMGKRVNPHEVNDDCECKGKGFCLNVYCPYKLGNI